MSGATPWAVTTRGRGGSRPQNLNFSVIASPPARKYLACCPGRGRGNVAGGDSQHLRHRQAGWHLQCDGGAQGRKRLALRLPRSLAIALRENRILHEHHHAHDQDPHKQHESFFHHPAGTIYVSCIRGPAPRRDPTARLQRTPPPLTSREERRSGEARVEQHL